MNPKYMASILVLAAIIYSALWSTLGTNAKRSMINTLEQLRDQGMTVSYKDPKLGGFPYRMEISMDDVLVNAPRQGWRFQSENITLIGHAWKPDHWFIDSTGTTGDLLNGGLVFTTPTLVVSAQTNGDNSLMLGIDLSSAVFAGRLTQGSRLKGEVTELHLRLPRNIEEQTGGLMEETRFDGLLRVKNFKDTSGKNPTLTNGELAFAWHGAGPTKWRKEAIAAWRDNGGTLEVSRLSLQWGADELQADISLSLDEQFKPLGAGSLTITGAPLNHFKALGLFERVPQIEASESFISAQFGHLEINGVIVAELPSIAP